MVNEQGNMVDNIESNISNIAVDTTSAAEELGTAHRYQKRAGRRAACLMLVIVFVVCIVLIAVSFMLLPLINVLEPFNRFFHDRYKLDSHYPVSTTCLISCVYEVLNLELNLLLRLDSVKNVKLISMEHCILPTIVNTLDDASDL